MKLGIKVKENIARTIADYFTTNGIVNVFTDTNIRTDKTLYAKWRITLDAFNNTATEEAFFHILEEFCHPLNFTDQQIRSNFIDALNKILSYENLTIQSTERYSTVTPINGQSAPKTEVKNSRPKETAEDPPDINKSTYTEKVLNLVAKEFCDVFSNLDIRKIITPIIEKNPILFNQKNIHEYLIDELFEENPFNTFNDVLQTIRKKDRTADETIAKIITELLHPLNHNADENKVKILTEKIGKYLKYNSLYIVDNGFNYPEICHEEQVSDALALPAELESEIYNERKEIIKNKEKIKILRDNHQAFIDVIEIFCQDTKKPTKELNDAYIFLAKKIAASIGELRLDHHELSLYRPFKTDLYSAEIEWNGDGALDNLRLGPKLSWDAIRPTLYMVHSNIIKIQNIAEEASQMTGDEKKLDEITNLIAQKRIQKPSKIEPQKTMRIEIEKMPDLNIRNADDNTLTKNKKKISLPKFSHTEWNKAEIRFIDKNTVYLTADKKTATADYESLGFRNDSNGKPNTAWHFLFELAKRNGETLVIKSPIPDNIKQQKMALSDRLKDIFKTTSDPFFDFLETNTYKIRLKLTPPTDEPSDRLGINDYLEKTMTSEND